MSYTFDEIMAFHPDNPFVYEEIKENISCLIPFVGAGLSQFAYYSWPNALENLSNKITDNTDHCAVHELIQSGNLMEAAQRLEDLRGKTNLSRDLVHLFSKNKLIGKEEILKKEAISVLPFLFKGSVFTTNFDETLESVYQNHGSAFTVISHPGHTELLNQLLTCPNTHGLYKFHGSIHGTMIEYDKLVFTDEQYQMYYGKNSILTNDLKEIFKKRMMLFLGCSLQADRTMEVLQSALQLGVNHYTIINCKTEERDKKLRQLDNLHIRAILYEDKKHEAVRVILEHLLEEIYPEQYRALPFKAGMLSKSVIENRFAYDAGIIKLSGRTKEMEQLKRFCTEDMESSFCWWTITGPGGSGKSRLAYDFQQTLDSGWTIRYLNHGDYKKLSEISDNCTGKTLFIADYVYAHAQELGKWMENLYDSPHCLPRRVLLVERNETSPEEKNTWVNLLYENVLHSKNLKKSCFDSNFLTLQPLEKDMLLQIMEDYASAMHCTLSDTQKMTLFEKLQLIDPKMQRPLYALFLTDAVVHGNRPEHWDRKTILDYVIEREKERIRFSLKQILGVTKLNQKLYDACMQLLCAATVWQDAESETLMATFPKEWGIIEKSANCFNSPKDWLQQVGLLEGDNFPALRPDLVGEYLVYDWLFPAPNQTRKGVEAFLSAVWGQFIPTLIFFDRLFNDYGSMLTVEQWRLLLSVQPPLTESKIKYYAMLLLNTTAFCSDLKLIEEIVAKLEQLKYEYSDHWEFALVYAKGLFNLSNNQDMIEAQQTIDKLSDIKKKWAGHNDDFIYLIQLFIQFIKSDNNGKDAIWPLIIEQLEIVESNIDL